MTFDELKEISYEIKKMIKTKNPDSNKLNTLKKKFLEELDLFLMNAYHIYFVSHSIF